ncbi:hypothetical protein QE152_g31149 [Popillia japonica]|uniref:Uncharacterized protein n=1 Tax=Popillia japonica TaxID=7064 RepID=A0AAW1JB68_POPJA
MAYRHRYHDHLHLARPRGRTHGVSKRRSDPMSGCLSLDMSSDNACAVRQMSLFAIGAAVRKREFEHRIGPVIIIIPASFATHGDSPYRYVPLFWQNQCIEPRVLDSQIKKKQKVKRSVTQSI